MATDEATLATKAVGPRVPRPEIVLYQAPKAKLQWPAEVLSRDGDSVRIQIFDRLSTEKLVPARSLSVFGETPGNLKSSELRKSYKLANTRLDG